MNELLSFYTGHGCDSAGRTFDQLLRFSDAELERTHDYIQWLFPLSTRSQAVPSSPQLDTPTITMLRDNPQAQERIRLAFARMLQFYGLLLDDDPDDPIVDRGPHWESRHRNWLSKGNHNYHRITRILTSLHVLGRPKYALAFYDCLALINRDHGGKIGDAFAHWRGAVR